MIDSYRTGCLAGSEAPEDGGSDWKYARELRD
jgi:hypothetical protein